MGCPKCGCDKTEEFNHFYEEHYIVEYSVRCVDCKLKLSTWSYGSWFDNDDLESEVN
ncbi:hypothetical protein M670_00171 [Schinkia azotoformans MEV2011]|uniref:Uncharacterized protein n=1 Tax=Schinkia azotoformans MEV2011 TaxID=1348973 RepID=A0A072P3X1_SCHAZ|nr:hypothetical protein M670_00171 [Schinkia azotoformans MEV2011]